MEPQVIVALLSAGAIIGAAVVTGFVAARKDSASIALQIANETRKELAEVRTRLDAMEAELSTTRRKHQKLSEKYSVSVAYILTLLTSWSGLRMRLKSAGFRHGEPPPIPEIIAVDMEHPPEETLST